MTSTRETIATALFNELIGNDWCFECHDGASTQHIEAESYRIADKVIALLNGPAGPVAFNVNERVRVKLTDRGRKLTKSHRVREDAEGWSEWQLWDLMSVLGEHCFMGPVPPFETTILLCSQAEPPHV